MTPAINFSSK